MTGSARKTHSPPSWTQTEGRATEEGLDIEPGA